MTVAEQALAAGHDVANNRKQPITAPTREQVTGGCILVREVKT